MNRIFDSRFGLPPDCAFAGSDERVLNVGGAIVGDAVRSLLEIDGEAFHQLVIRSGELGEALATLWNERPHPSVGAPITLSQLAESFDALATARAQENKQKMLVELFARCIDPREAAYLAKIIFRDMRTGVQEGVLQAAIAQAFGRDLKRVHRCQLLVGDLDEVAVLAAGNALELARFRLFHPIQFMLATPQETPEAASQTMGQRPFFAEDKLDGIRAGA